MRRTPPLLLFAGICAAVVLAELTRDRAVLSGALVAVALALSGAMLAISPFVRGRVAMALPPLAWLGRVVMALRWRTIGIVVAACLAAFAAGAAWQAVAYPHGDLRAHLVDVYGPRLHARQPPLRVSAALDRDWPADDQRYTPAGVLLRYEHAIVALLPDGQGGTRIDVERPEAGFRRFYAYLGAFWGATYLRGDGVPASAQAVPGERDMRAARRLLTAAGRAQGVCYRWDVDIRSGRRAGRIAGAAGPRDCARVVELVGWIDPLAGRLAGRGDPGDWSLGYTGRLTREIPRASVAAVDPGFGQIIEGRTQRLNDDGEHAGKGLIEHLEAMPLLAEDADGVPPAPIAAAHPPPGARPSPAARTDSSRRAETSWIAIPPAILFTFGGLTLAFVVLGLAVAGAARLLRRVAARAMH